MLTYTSTALVSFLLSFGSVATPKAMVAQVQPVAAFPTQTVASVPANDRLSHRGSGRFNGGMVL